jgi:hypothetical protein
VGSGDYGNTMHAYHNDGSAVDGWPRRIPQRDTPYPRWDRRTSASLADIDSDGRTELAVAVEGYVYLWDTNGLPHAPWPTFKSDMQRTGKAHIERSQGYLPLISKLP